MANPLEALPTVRLVRGRLLVIDQTLLPSRYEIRSLATLDAVCEAMRSLRVRGAPALGITGAYGLLVALEEVWGGDPYIFDSRIGAGGAGGEDRIERFPSSVSMSEIRTRLDRAAERLVTTRPTAVNLSRALERMRRVYVRDTDTHTLLRDLLREADAIHDEDLAMCRALATHGERLLRNGDAVLTHCNTGGLATGGVGTALGVVFAASAAGKRVHVFATETRPLLQGARLTAWECEQRGVPVTVLVDAAAASLIASRLAACVIVGADRIAANGDTANKVGTLSLAVLAGRFGVPFYVAAPSSTIDASLANGSSIPLEHRSPEEVTRVAGVPVAPDVAAFNPAFDVTPAELITAIVTEHGVHRPPYAFHPAR